MSWHTWQRRMRNLRAHPHPLRFMLSRALWLSGASRLLSVELPDGQRIRFYPSSLSAALWVSASGRNDDVDVLRLVLRTGDTYVDCGANIGHLAVIGRGLVGASGAVTAVEANPRIYRYCVGNLELNGYHDVLALNVALGDSRGSVRISDRRDDDQNAVGGEGTIVAMRQLDEIIGANSVRLLKLDVEGYELAVLRGGRRTLGRTDVVYCELSASNCERFGYQPIDAERYLLDAGFVFLRRRGSEWLVIREPIYARLDRSEQARTGCNILAIKPDCVSDLLASAGTFAEGVEEPAHTACTDDQGNEIGHARGFHDRHDRK